MINLLKKLKILISIILREWSNLWLVSEYIFAKEYELMKESLIDCLNKDASFTGCEKSPKTAPELKLRYWEELFFFKYSIIKSSYFFDNGNISLLYLLISDGLLIPIQFIIYQHFWCRGAKTTD